ncbi:hypothetical protein [Agathobacter sp.]|uniref:hypothetical protein n=1 Tax=Agathobacter sp. TaxID=2021311 RepID=UPI00280B3697|nr:hypothetical protein [Agathobacter sp.]
MKRYGNFRFTRRMVVFVCLLVVSVSVLMNAHIVYAQSNTQNSVLSIKTDTSSSGFRDNTLILSHNHDSSAPVYSFILESTNSIFPNDKYSHQVYCGYVSKNDFTGCDIDSSNFFGVSGSSVSQSDGVYFYNYGLLTFQEGNKFSGSSSDIFMLYDSDYLDCFASIANYVLTGEKSDGMIIGGSGYRPNTQAYSEIGCLDNVQMETYVTNKKELIDADENADLSKINQDKVIVYSSSTTSGIDLSKGGYRVQLYGSYAWQDKKGNIKSEDKGHKTFIKDWDAQDNIKGLDRSKYRWIDWKSANYKVEADKTDKAHKPNVFEKMTTYANYQYEPIWYLRIVSQDNKYGAWVKLYNSTNKGKYRSESVDDDDNAVPDSGGGYKKPKDTSEITGTGDTPEDAKNNVPKAEEKQDNDDLNDSANGNNSTFDKLEQFTKGIGDVPKMIADIFSFLPSWCLEVVAIGFALLMILVVVKFIRG